LIGPDYRATRYGLLDARASGGLSDFVFSRPTLPPLQPWGYRAAALIGIARVRVIVG
jgi:hypothetical protein